MKKRCRLPFIYVLVALLCFPLAAQEFEEDFAQESERDFGSEEIEEEAQNPAVQQALKHLESEKLSEKQAGVQKIRDLLSDPQKAGLSSYDQAQLHHALGIIGGADFAQLLSPSTAQRWENAPLTAEQELALESGEPLDLQSMGQGLTPKELQGLSRYIVDLGKSVDMVYFSHSLLDAPAMGVGPTYEENKRTFLENRKVMKERIRSEVQRAIPTYQNLTQEQKDALVNAIFNRSTRVGYTLRKQIDITPQDSDAEGQLKKEAVPALQTAIKKAIGAGIRIPPSDVEADFYTHEMPTGRPLTLEEFSQLKPTQITRVQAQEFNGALEQIKVLKENVASAALSAGPPPSEKYFLKDARYSEYHLGKSLLGFFSNVEESLQKSIDEAKTSKDPKAKDKLNARLSEYQEFIKGVPKEILAQSKFEGKSTYDQKLVNPDSAQNIESLLELVQQSKTRLTTRYGQLGETFESAYQDQLLPFSNLTHVVSDQGTFMGAQNSAQAFQKLTGEYFKDHKDSPAYREIVKLGLQSSHPSVQVQAVGEIATQYQGQDQRKALSHFLNSRSEQDFGAEIQRLCTGKPSFTKSAFDAMAANVRREIPAGHTKSNNSQAAAVLGHTLNRYMAAYQASPSSCAEASQLAEQMAQTLGNTFVDELTPYKRQLTGQFSKLCEKLKKKTDLETSDPICDTVSQNALHIPQEYNNDHDRALYIEGKVLACAEEPQVTLRDTAIYCEENPSYGSTAVSQIHDDVRSLAQFQNPHKSKEAQLKLRSDYLKALRKKMVDALRQNLVAASPYVDSGRLQQGVTALQNLGSRCSIPSPEHIQKIQATPSTGRNQNVDAFLKRLLNVDENGVIRPFDDPQNNVIRAFSDFAALQSIVDPKNPEEPLNKAYFYGAAGAPLGEDVRRERQGLLAKDLEKRKQLASGPYAFLMDPLFRYGPDLTTAFYAQVLAFYTRGGGQPILEIKPQKGIRVSGYTESVGERQFSADMPAYEGLKQGLQKKFNEHYDSILKELFRYCDTLGCEALDGTYAPDVGEERTKAIVEASPILKTFFGESIEDIRTQNPEGKCIQGKTPQAQADRTAAVMLLMNNPGLRKAVLDEHPEYADIDCELQNDVKNLTPHFPVTQTVVAVADIAATIGATVTASYFGGALGGALVGGTLGGIYTADAYQNWNKAELAAQETEAAFRAHGVASHQLRGSSMDQLLQSYQNVSDAANTFYLAAATSAVFDVGTAGVAVGRGISRARNLNSALQELRTAPKGNPLRTAFEKFSENPKNSSLIHKYGSAELGFLAARQGEKVVTEKMALRAAQQARKTARAARRHAIEKAGGWVNYYRQKMAKAAPAKVVAKPTDLRTIEDLIHAKGKADPEFVKTIEERLNRWTTLKGEKVTVKIVDPKDLETRFPGRRVLGYFDDTPGELVLTKDTDAVTVWHEYLHARDWLKNRKVPASAKLREMVEARTRERAVRAAKVTKTATEADLLLEQALQQNAQRNVRREMEIAGEIMTGPRVGYEVYTPSSIGAGEFRGKIISVDQEAQTLRVKRNPDIAGNEDVYELTFAQLRGEEAQLRVVKTYPQDLRLRPETEVGPIRWKRIQKESAKEISKERPPFVFEEVPAEIKKAPEVEAGNVVQYTNLQTGRLQQGIFLGTTDQGEVLIKIGGGETPSKVPLSHIADDFTDVSQAQRVADASLEEIALPNHLGSAKPGDLLSMTLSDGRTVQGRFARNKRGETGIRIIKSFRDKSEAVPLDDIDNIKNISQAERRAISRKGGPVDRLLKPDETVEISNRTVRQGEGIEGQFPDGTPVQGTLVGVREQQGQRQLILRSRDPLTGRDIIRTVSHKYLKITKITPPETQMFREVAVGKRIKSGLQKLKEKVTGKKILPPTPQAPPALGAKFTHREKTWQVIDIDDKGFVLGRGKDRIRYNHTQQESFARAFKRDETAKLPPLEGDIKLPLPFKDKLGREKVQIGDILAVETPAGNRIEGPIAGLSDSGDILFVKQGELRYPLQAKRIKVAQIKTAEEIAPAAKVPEPRAPPAQPVLQPLPAARQRSVLDWQNLKHKAQKLDEGSQVDVWAHPHDEEKVIKEYRKGAHTNHQETQRVRQKMTDLGYEDLLARVEEEFADPKTKGIVAYTQERVTPLFQWKGKKPDLSRVEEAVQALQKEGIDIEVKSTNLGIRKDGTVVIIDTDDLGVITRGMIKRVTHQDPFSPQAALQQAQPLKPGDMIYFTYRTKEREIKEELLGKILSPKEAEDAFPKMGRATHALLQKGDISFLQYEKNRHLVSEIARPFAEALPRQPFIRVIPKKMPSAPVPDIPSPPKVPVAKAPVDTRSPTAVFLSPACEGQLGTDACLHLQDHFSSLPQDVFVTPSINTFSHWVNRGGGELTPAENYLLSKARELHPGNVEVERVFTAMGVQDPTKALTSERSLDKIKKEWQSLRKSIETMPKESAQAQSLLLQDLDEVYALHISAVGLDSLSTSESLGMMEQRWERLGKYVAPLPHPETRKRLVNKFNMAYVEGVQHHAQKILGEKSQAYTAFLRLAPELAPREGRGIASVSWPRLRLGTALLENTYAIGGRDLTQANVFDILHHLRRTNSKGYDDVVQEMVRTLQKEGAESLNGHIYQAHVGTKFATSPKKIVTKVTYEPKVPAAPGGTEGRADMIFEYWSGRNSLIETKTSLAFPETSEQGLKLKAQLERYARVLKEDIPIDGVPITFVEIHSPRQVPEGHWIDKLVDALNATLPEGKQIKFEVTP